MPPKVFTASSVRVRCPRGQGEQQITLGGKAMSDKRIKHFIFMRFYSFEDSRYPHDIYDVDFLSKQLLLTRNALGSLENQSNKNFELIFVMNAKFFEEPKYEFLFKTLTDSTSLPLKFMKNVGRSFLFTPSSNSECAALIEEAQSKYEFVITTRMDFDDFAYKDGVADTQNKVDECENILAYGYLKGYEYSHGELHPYFPPWRGNDGHPGILQSVISKSSFAKTIPYFTVESFNHHILKQNLKTFLERNGVEFSERMFQSNVSLNAFIYFRHDFSHSVSTRENELERLSKRKLLTTADITKRQLEEEFGFTGYELKSIE